MGEEEGNRLEIHKTEFVDKELPTIYFESTKQHDMTHGEQVTIRVSDKISERAFQTFKKVRDEVKEKGGKHDR